MKRIYLFGGIIRMVFILSFLLLICAFTYIYIQSDFKVIYLLLLIFIVGFVVFGLIWMYSMGVFVDRKNNTVKIVTGFLKEEKVVRRLSDIHNIDVERNVDIGMNFMIYYKNGRSEKIYYKFYRISMLEKSQYKRIKKQLSSICEISEG